MSPLHALLARLERGFGGDAQGRLFDAVAEFGRALTETPQRGAPADPALPPSARAGADVSSGEPPPVAETRRPKPAEPDPSFSSPIGVTPATPAADPVAPAAEPVPPPSVKPDAGFSGPADEAGPASGSTGTGPGASSPSAGGAADLAPALGRIETSAAHGFQDATQALERLDSALTEGFRTLSERMERLEQSAAEHASQLGNRA